MVTDTLREIFGTLRTPLGATYPNKSLQWFRSVRATVAQGSSVVVDQPMIITTDAVGAINTSVLAGDYLVMVPLSDADRYFRVVVPDAVGPFDISSLIDGQMAEPDSLTQFEALVAKAKAWAAAPEDLVVEDAEYSAKHHAIKAAVSAASAGASAASAGAASAAALLSQGLWPTTAAGIGNGVAGTTSLIAGSGGTDGTFPLAFTGGTQVLAPVGVFVVAGGALVSILITYAGYYSAGTPTLVFTASAGLTGASATAVMAVNTSITEYFSVPSADSNLLLDLYRVDAGPVATMVRSYPSAAAVDAVAARRVGFLAPPAVGSVLDHVIALEIYTSVGGVAVTLPALFTVREIARDALDRFRLRLASFDGASTYVSVATENNGGGVYINVAGYTGLVWMDLLADGVTLGVADNTPIGRALIDFNAGGTFGTYTATIAQSVGGVTPALAQVGPVFTNDATEIVKEQAEIVAGAKIPFADTMRGSDTLRRLVRSIWLYDVDPTHDFVLSVMSVTDLGGGSFRMTATVRDLTAARDVATARYSAAAASVAAFIGTLPEYLKGEDAVVSPKNRSTVAFRFDWSVVTGLFSYGGATTALAGIHESCIYGRGRQRGYLTDDTVHVVYTIGAAGDYTTLDAALADASGPGSLIWGHVNVNGQPISDKSHFARRVQLFFTDVADYSVGETEIPDWIELDGVPGARLVGTTAATSGIIEFHGSGKIKNIEIVSNTTGGGSKYALHMDDSNRSVGPESFDGGRMKVVRGVRLTNGSGNTVQVLGGGISSGETWVLDGVDASHVDASVTTAAIGVHNTGPTASTPATLVSTRPSYLSARGVTSKSQLGLQLYSISDGARCVADITGSQFNRVLQLDSIGSENPPNRAADRYIWDIIGKYDGPIEYRSPNGLVVMQTSAGQTASGTGAAALFGTTDDLGRGDLYVRDTTTQSMGARLGDCSVTNKTLTIGVQSHVFTANETAKSNATLISEINASITTYPVSTADIQHEFVAAALPQQRATNSTGSTIPKGRFVRFTGAATIALCAAGERPDGWTHRDILTGTDGYVVLTRRIADAYVGGASSSTGEWGITTAGTLDYAATVKLGRTIGNVVEVW